MCHNLLNISFKDLNFDYWVEDHGLFRVAEGFTKEQQEVVVL